MVVNVRWGWHCCILLHSAVTLIAAILLNDLVKVHTVRIGLMVLHFSNSAIYRLLPAMLMAAMRCEYPYDYLCLGGISSMEQ